MDTSSGDKKIEKNSVTTQQPSATGANAVQDNIPMVAQSSNTQSAAKDAEDGGQHMNRHRILLIGGIVLGVIVLVTIVCVLVLVLTSGDSSDPESSEINATVEEIRNEENKAVFQDVYNEATEAGESEEAVNAAFQQAVSAAGNTTGAANAARVSQMRYLLEKGNYEEVIKLSKQPNGGGGDGSTNSGNGGNNTNGGGTNGGNTSGESVFCDNPNLGLDLRVTCYNILGLVYAYDDQYELSDYYMTKMREVMDERTRLFYEQK